MHLAQLNQSQKDNVRKIIFSKYLARCERSKYPPAKFFQQMTSELCLAPSMTQGLFTKKDILVTESLSSKGDWNLGHFSGRCCRRGSTNIWASHLIKQNVVWCLPIHFGLNNTQVQITLTIGHSKESGAKISKRCKSSPISAVFGFYQLPELKILWVNSLYWWLLWIILPSFHQNSSIRSTRLEAKVIFKINTNHVKNIANLQISMWFKTLNIYFLLRWK